MATQQVRYPRVDPGHRYQSGLSGPLKVLILSRRCQGCFFRHPAGGRTKWFKAMKDPPWRYPRHLRVLADGTWQWDVAVLDLFTRPKSRGPSRPVEFWNLPKVLEAQRKATERSPWPPVLRGYDRLGRCVLWSP
jgi:hypothetical protein